MTFVGRKIARAKWENKTENIDENEIPADAVTVDLKTVRNTLSFWKCGDGRQSTSELHNPLLAMASEADRIDKVELVWIDLNEFEKLNIITKETDGVTPVTILRQTHINFCDLDLVRHGKIVELIAAALKDGRYYRFTRHEVRTLLAEAVGGSLVKLEDLKEKVQVEITPILNP